MTQDEIDAILSMGTTEDEIAELLRQKERAEGEIDSTRGKDYLMNAGRMVRANPYQAVADMFIRGNAQKRIQGMDGDIANKRRTLDERTGEFHRAASGLGLGGVDLRAGPKVAGPSRFPMPSVPPVPPVGGSPNVPVPPPGAGAPPGPPPPPPVSPVAAPQPAPAPVPPPQPVPPPPAAPRRLQTHAGWDDAPRLPKSEDELIADEIIARLSGGR